MWGSQCQQMRCSWSLKLLRRVAIGCMHADTHCMHSCSQYQQMRCSWSLELLRRVALCCMHADTHCMHSRSQ